MGMLYRRKVKDRETEEKVEQGPWWIKYYDQGHPVYESTGKLEKREAMAALKRAEGKVVDGQREGPAVNWTKFEDLVEVLKLEYQREGRKTWTRREDHLRYLRPVFGGAKLLF